VNRVIEKPAISREVMRGPEIILETSIPYSFMKETDRLIIIAISRAVVPPRLFTISTALEIFFPLKVEASPEIIF
jgi:hypothetical protein